MKTIPARSPLYWQHVVRVRETRAARARRFRRIAATTAHVLLALALGAAVGFAVMFLLGGTLAKLVAIVGRLVQA